MLRGKEYKIYYIEALPPTNDGKRGLFHIVTSDKTIPIEITISGTFLATWDRAGDTSWGATLVEIGSLLAEHMFLYDNIHDMTLITTDFPQHFQTGENGYQKMKAYLQEQIDQKKLTNFS